MGKGTFKIICAPFFRRVWQARNSKVSPSMEHCPEREDSQVTGSVIIYSNTKRKTDSERNSGYYAAILSGKEDHGLWSVSTAKQFASSLRQHGLQVSLFASVSIRSC